jgi:AraC-like DNA-binding protein/ligand-binding sensor protein
MDFSAAVRYSVQGGTAVASNRALEIILKQDVQKIFDQFSSCFNIRILFFSPDGEKQRVGLNRPDSEYCRLVQTKILGRGGCRTFDKARLEEAANKGSMICYRCHAGLLEAMKPVYFEQNLLGFVAIGQFRSEELPTEDVMAEWEKSGCAEDLLATYRALPCVARQQVDDILGLFSILVDYIVSQRMIALRGNLAIEEIISYVESHIDRPITLQEVAGLVHKSTSTVSHMFKQKLGKSFKQTVVEARLRRAEELMANDPDITIGEAASRVGYFDQLHFSRIYRRYRKSSPRDFQKSCRDTSGDSGS